MTTKEEELEKERAEVKAKIDKIDVMLDKANAKYDTFDQKLQQEGLSDSQKQEYKEERAAAERQQSELRQQRGQLLDRNAQIVKLLVPLLLPENEANKRLRLSTTTDLPKEEFLAALAKCRLDDRKLVFDVKEYTTGDTLIYIRPCYEKLFSKIALLVLNGTNCLVTGTPGIVIYIYQGWGSCHLFVPKEPKPGVAAVLSQFQIAYQRDFAIAQGWVGRFIDNAGKLAQPARELYGALSKLVNEVVVIVDSPKQWGADVFLNPPCGLFAVSSPSPDRVTSLKSDDDAFTFWMPNWEKQEIRDLLIARKNGMEITEQEELELELRELQFGYIPRHIAKANLRHDQMLSIGVTETTQAIRELTGPNLLHAVNPISVTPQISGRLIHILVDNDFNFRRKTFASEIIERKIITHFHMESRVNWTAFAAAVYDVQGFASMVGQTSEIWWHGTLQAGGNFTLVELKMKTGRSISTYSRGQKIMVEFPQSEPRYSAKQNLSDIVSLWDPSPGTQCLYFNFLKKNVPAIDSVWVIDGNRGKEIFDKGSRDPAPPVYVCATQMTITSKEKLNATGVETFMEIVRRAAPPDARVELIFITSPAHAPAFHYILVEAYPNLRQWLIEVPENRIFS